MLKFLKTLRRKKPLPAKERPGEKLIAEACAAYGIEKQYVFASRIDVETGEAVIVTHGGKKVRYKAGQKVEPLDDIAITGVNPNPKRRGTLARVTGE
jgi:hypothetical protein